ncbi:ribosome biogenesis protein brix [Holotrichia oblita]|uniref:Ribosome biogenesis protein brix n=1 Tax=Holotrichia oblita TaxID=644536 RepID=A0ACB9T1Z7_HOLOL|nr:ribosome biogenesis protein brix [Holotrichia oblita]
MKTKRKLVVSQPEEKENVPLPAKRNSDEPIPKKAVYTMAELKLTGNCLRGSRPLLSFDPSFNEKPHYALLKELLVQTFGVPNHHPKSQPFFDHVYIFMVLDNRIWFRNFQILSEDGALAEVGPRFVLNPVKIFSGSFGGVPLWENPHYLSPAKFRQQFRLSAKNKYLNRMQQKIQAEATRPKESYKFNPLDNLFKGDPLEVAQDIQDEEAIEIDNKTVQNNSVKKSNSDKASKLKKKKQKKPNQAVVSNKRVNNNKKPKVSIKASKLSIKRKVGGIVNNKKKSIYLMLTLQQRIYLIQCYGTGEKCYRAASVLAVHSAREAPRLSLRKRAIITGISKSHLQRIFKENKILPFKPQFRQTSKWR